jgi:hypothetical protein
MVTQLFIPLVVMTALWGPVTERCSTFHEDSIMMRCESGGLVSLVEYSGPIHVSARVHVKPAADGRFWAGLALNSDVPNDDQYTQAALTQGIAPYWTTLEPWGVQLSTPADRCCDWLVPVDLSEPHVLTVDYDGKGNSIISVDGHAVMVAVDLGRSYVIELLCVAVDPGESKPGAYATCLWDNIQTVVPQE